MCLFPWLRRKAWQFLNKTKINWKQNFEYRHLFEELFYLSKAKYKHTSHTHTYVVFLCKKASSHTHFNHNLNLSFTSMMYRQKGVTVKNLRNCLKWKINKFCILFPVQLPPFCMRVPNVYFLHKEEGLTVTPGSSLWSVVPFEGLSVTKRSFMMNLLLTFIFDLQPEAPIKPQGLCSDF